jgi:hypothetical protein
MWLLGHSWDPMPSELLQQNKNPQNWGFYFVVKVLALAGLARAEPWAI